MTGESFVIVIDTPSVKKYVFGTDSLNEVRGASARLDYLNRVEMEKCLCEYLFPHGVRVELIYANGGSAQFLVHECDESTARAACTSMVQYIREQTGGEVRVVYGIAPMKDKTSYPQAVRMAHFQLRAQREFATCHRSTALIPTMMECKSASHLPAYIEEPSVDGISLLLSNASYEKVQQGREASRRGLWADWVQSLADKGDSWPAKEYWDKLRCDSLTDIGDCSSWGGYIGVVYADGNSMGQIIQGMNQQETFRQFSRIVDESIQEACFDALSQVSEKEVANVQKALKDRQPFESLPADILLLGGDDLLVAVPADRALNFALSVTETFERLTQEKINALQDKETRQFFRDRLGDQSFTISCGVAIAKSNYPFYLLLDLAEQLLKNAKRKDGHYSQSITERDARIDFHVVAGANSYALEQLREDTYRVDDGTTPRTLRPLSCAQLRKLQASVQKLEKVRFPHSKLHELHEAALAKEWIQADWRIREIFARCQHGPETSQRRALWEAISNLRPEGYKFAFPWFKKDDQQLLCMADLVDAYRLFGQ